MTSKIVQAASPPALAKNARACPERSRRDGAPTVPERERRTRKAGPPASQHPVCRRFRYDTQSTPDAGVTVANTLGRREFAGTDDCGSQGNGQWNPITREWFSYSVRGELTDVYELTPNSGGFYHTTAGYAPNGALTSLGLPAAAGSWTYTLDSEGRPFSATNGSTVNVASVTYNVASLPLVISYAALNRDNDTYTYFDTTGRMHTYAFTIGSTPQTITGTYGWNQNGSLQNLAITDPFYAVDQQTCNYGYDDLARLSSVDCGATVWQQNFTYDAYGNITKSVPLGGTGGAWNPGYNPANNHYTLGGTTYDNNGNLTYDTFNHYTWDAYGQMTAINSQAITYDALGREVEKSNPAGGPAFETGYTCQFSREPNGIEGSGAPSLRTLQGRVCTRFMLPTFLYATQLH